MRDPDRIYPFLAELGKIWMRVPDWRFGQLISNVFGAMASDGRDPFFPEEDEMLSFFKKYFNIKS